MGIRVSQDVVEALIIGEERNLRVSQLPIEVLISDVITPAKCRMSQMVVEVLLVSAPPSPVTHRYGPRIQSV